MPQMPELVTSSAPVSTHPSLVQRMANHYGVDPNKFLTTLKQTAFRQSPDRQTGQISEPTNEEMMALLVVAEQYHLNPFTREIYAFPDNKRGGIVPILGVDGWARIINEHPQFDGMEFSIAIDTATNKPDSVTCVIHRKDRSHSVSVTELYRECKRDTSPWNSHPTRMLRHKAMIQCARLAFGFVGMYDEDEGARIIEGNVSTTSAPAVDELNAEVTKAAEKTPEPVIHEAEIIPAPTMADVIKALKAAKTTDEADMAMDASNHIEKTPQQAAEIDVEYRAALKRVKKE